MVFCFLLLGPEWLKEEKPKHVEQQKTVGVINVFLGCKNFLVLDLDYNMDANNGEV
jgi:hypothetical protein